VREVGPLGAREIQLRDALERLRLLLGPARAQALVDLLVVEGFELAVVVE